MIMHSCPSTPEAERQTRYGRWELQAPRGTSSLRSHTLPAFCLRVYVVLFFPLFTCFPSSFSWVLTSVPTVILPRCLFLAGGRRIGRTAHVQIFATWSRGSISASLVLWWVLVRVLHMLDVCDSCALSCSPCLGPLFLFFVFFFFHIRQPPPLLPPFSLPSVRSSAQAV
jgi:hypothetical protein